MTSPRSIPPPTTITSGLEIANRDDRHRHRRRFVGPMPESVISNMDGHQRTKGNTWIPFLQRQPTSSSDEEVGVRNAIREHALQFFLGHGGRKEDWGESQEKGVREEMYRRWKESEWGQARARRRELKSSSVWVGSSFDVGVFLGVDLLIPSPSIQRTLEADSAMFASPSHVAVTGPTAAETSVTAPAFPNEGTSTFRHLPLQPPVLPRLLVPSSNDNLARPVSTDSSTPLLPTPAVTIDDHSTNGRSVPHDQGCGISSSSVSAASDVNGTQGLIPPVHSSKGKAKMVHYSDEPTPHEEPASPSEVLARTGSAVQDTSAGAALQATAENQVKWGDVVMRDRMLVQVSFSNLETVGANFDETKNRVTPHMQYDNWKEFIVVWRKDRLEIYKDHSTPGKEWFTGHKHLAFVIPLNRNNTRLSLYSFTDLTFCITCPPTPLRTRNRRTRRWLLYGTQKGTNIFIFNVKTRTRAADWLWKLWRHLGGELPPFVEIRCPAIDTRLKIDIPGYNTSNIDAAYAVFTPSNIIGLCMQVLYTVDEYNEVISHALKQGTSLGLAWRMDSRLDWVWQISDVEGKSRAWSILCGLAMRQGNAPSHLELRLQGHRATRLTLKDGTRLDEPPSIEGYADRIRPSSQLKQALYLSTHNGYLFFTHAMQAHPPPPPGPSIGVNDSQALNTSETIRGARQVLEATGMTDLRNVVAVRRAFQVIPSQSEEVAAHDVPEWEDGESFWENVDNYDDDYRDGGGEEGLANVQDKQQRQVRRSFELLLKSGRIMRFEVYSCQYALEWIARLRPLISYWKKRHQVDAREEMDLVHASTGRPRITARRHVHDEQDAAPETPPDPDKSSPDLSSFYNWCLLDGCRAISKCGKLFSRKGLRGQYKHVQLVLVPGHLVQFRITGTSLYHRRGKVLHLLDSYVCSGYFAAQYLPEGQYDPDSPPLPRRYQDGLESNDQDEDTLFMIWSYKKERDAYVSSKNIPPLSAKRQIFVFRTRSKLERDAWVWAIKAEVEKAARDVPAREKLLREDGELLT